MDGLVLTPSDFVAVLNQTLEHVYPLVAIEGELSSFRISKNRWVYFDLQDEQASVKFFGTIYNLPGPLEDGLKIRVLGTPKLHPRFGFSVNIASIQPVGEGSIKKAAQLVMAKLEAEGLFEPSRKRLLPPIPRQLGLITAANSAAYSDFIKILNDRWGGVEVRLADVYVQGAQAPSQIVEAIEYFNRQPSLADVLVVTRGGGSAEDLAAFSDERVVRAIAASRIPTLVAIGHESDTSLAELAADLRASTPSNAVQLLVPDKRHQLAAIASSRIIMGNNLRANLDGEQRRLESYARQVSFALNNYISGQYEYLRSNLKLAVLLDPRAALKRGYAIVSKAGRHLSSVKGLAAGHEINIQLSDGKINSKVTAIKEINAQSPAP